MPKSPFPTFKRHSNHSDPSPLTVPQSVRHPYVKRISDILFIVTDNFVSPIQHHIYPAAAIHACLTHESAIRDDPEGMKSQPTPIGFDILARVYNAEARGTPRFAHYARDTHFHSAVTYGDRMKLEDWNITPAQCGIIQENPAFKQLMEEEALRNLRRKANAQMEIAKRHARQLHKRDSDVIKQFAATHQTKADMKFKGKKKALVSTPITTVAPLPPIAPSQPVASSSSTTLDSLFPSVASTSTTDISMAGPSDAFNLTAEEILAGYPYTEDDAPYEEDTTEPHDDIQDNA
ncbi:hypothetical protein M413DRAFT_14436 [Hebeloma cylindrosporum]|uniref:Uncharacterized protein n=1 Tax=Hebeloma cylindrosporum TaxID=76867 RepID=A0A0C2Y3P9_HEBCY|nr:hypothetical protein M413DRAFT_14436 [Hebeloma cylindrosporum h7]